VDWPPPPQVHGDAPAALDQICSIHHDHVVGNDNTVRFEDLSLQIESQPFRYSLARCRLLVCQRSRPTARSGCG